MTLILVYRLHCDNNQAVKRSTTGTDKRCYLSNILVRALPS